MELKPKALFISNSLFIDPAAKEGGVKRCTLEYIDLIQHQFEVSKFALSYRRDWVYRIRVKTGLNAYGDYDTLTWAGQIELEVKQHNIRWLFFNQANTLPVAAELKKRLGSQITVILCSHGNESGDFLHAISSPGTKNGFAKRLRQYALGSMLCIEQSYRSSVIDLVLAVSEIDVAIEHWLGAKEVLLVPRTFHPKVLPRKPAGNRLGFVGDLFHQPNYIGVQKLAEHLNALGFGGELRLVGKIPTEVKNDLAKYSFVHVLGYLESHELELEASSWSVFLNPVFYASRGVSTKLALGLEWQIPVLTTAFGLRGYPPGLDSRMTVDGPTQMAQKAMEWLADQSILMEMKECCGQYISQCPSLSELSVALRNRMQLLYG